MNHKVVLLPIATMVALGFAASALLLPSPVLALSAPAAPLRAQPELLQSWAAISAPDPLSLLIAVETLNGQPMYILAKSQSYLGVDLRDVSQEELGELKLKEAHGAEITTVDHDGPAGKVGLRERDVVLQMNGQPIAGQDQLRRLLRETPPGHTVVLVISRDGQQQSVTVQLANRADVEREAWEQHFSVPDPQATPAPRIGGPASASASPGFLSGSGQSSGGGGSNSESSLRSSIFLPMFSFHSAYTGAMLDSLGPQLAAYFGAKSGTGLLVKSVDANSPAAAAGLKAGDVVVKVDSAEVTQPNDWLRSMREHKGKPVQVTVLRNKQEQTLNITPGAPKKK